MLLAFEYMGSGTGRRGRKSYAEYTKGIPKNTINYLSYKFLFLVQIFLNSFQFWLCFSPRFLMRPLRNFCVLCVLKSVFALSTISQLESAIQ